VPEVVAQATHIVCNSESTAADVMKFCGIPSQRITPIPLAYNPDRFRPLNLPRQNYFLYLGRSDPHKNLRRVIEAFAHQSPGGQHDPGSLRRQGLHALALSGELVQKDRERVMRRMKNGELEQTAILGGGDPFSPTTKVKPGVLSIFGSVDFPESIEARRTALEGLVSALRTRLKYDSGIYARPETRRPLRRPRPSPWE